MQASDTGAQAGSLLTGASGFLGRELLAQAGIDADPAEFRRYGSARQLYNFKIDNAAAY